MDRPQILENTFQPETNYLLLSFLVFSNFRKNVLLTKSYFLKNYLYLFGIHKNEFALLWFEFTSFLREKIPNVRYTIEELRVFSNVHYNDAQNSRYRYFHLICTKITIEHRSIFCNFG